MIDAAITTILFAFSATCANRSARMVGGAEANFWRLILSSMFLAVWAFTIGSGVSGRAFGAFFISGIVGIGIGDFGLFQSFPRLGTRLTMLLTLCLTSPMGILLEWVWLGQGVSRGEVICLVAILIGVGITLWPDSRIPLPPHHLIPGVLFALLAAVCGALGAVLSRLAYTICRDQGEPIDGATAAFQRVLGGLLVTSLIYGVVWIGRGATRVPKPAIPNKWRRLMPWVAGNALAGLTLGMSFMQRALESTRAGLVLAIIATTPIVIIPLARIVDGERISWRAVVGSVIAVAGASGLALVHSAQRC